MFERILFSIVIFIIFFIAAWAVFLQTSVQIGIRFENVPMFIVPAALIGALGVIIVPKIPGQFIYNDTYGNQQRSFSKLVWFSIFSVSIATVFWTGLIIGAGEYWSSVAFFAVLMIGLGIAFWRCPRSMTLSEAPLEASHVIATSVLGLSLAVLPLLFHRPDADDAHFLNLAVGMMMDPRPILTFDHLIGDPSQSILVPTYRVEVHHAFIATISKITGFEVIEVAHMIWPPVAAAFLFLTLRLFCRQFAGTDWLLALLICLTILFAYGIAHRSHGNFSFMRLQQGKSLVFLAIPMLIYVFSVRFWQHGRFSEWLVLVAVQTAGTSLSANAIFLNSFTLLIVSLSLLLTGPPRIGRFTLLGLSGFWTVAAALIVLSTTGATRSEYNFINTVMQDIIFTLNWHVGGIFLGVTFGIWILMDGWIRRFFIIIFILFTIIVLNPFLNEIIAELFTANLNWRLFYTLPIPALIGVAGAKFMNQAFESPAIRRILPWVAAVVLMGTAAGPTSILRPGNQVTFVPLGMDVTEHYDATLQIEALLSDEPTVLAPTQVAIWLATFGPPPPQVAVRTYYGHFYAETRSSNDIALRTAALQFASRGPEDEASALEELATYVEFFEITDLVIDATINRSADVKRAADNLGFVMRWQGDRYSLMQRRN